MIINNLILASKVAHLALMSAISRSVKVLGLVRVCVISVVHHRVKILLLNYRRFQYLIDPNLFLIIYFGLTIVNVTVPCGLIVFINLFSITNLAVRLTIEQLIHFLFL